MPLEMRRLRELEEENSPADEHPRHRSDHCDDNFRARTTTRELFEGPRLCGLARPHTKAALQRWEGEAGRARSDAKVAHHRQQRGRASG